MKKVTILWLLAMMAACSSEKRDPEEHVWKSQTEALEKAKAVEQTLEKGMQERMKTVNENR